MPKLTNNLHQVVPAQELVTVNSLHLPVEVTHEAGSALAGTRCGTRLWPTQAAFSFRRPLSRTARHRPRFPGVAAQTLRQGSRSLRERRCGRRS
ncbi:hypothetical protein EUGRSUZ_G01386 [Eucalyptus grandis]|uniref:Uncharacterized protein n=2 Tax=Eucalyptus grandis TaxID=71139 RepID=A0ACC3K253_EUCGR|nr:hypothetical protein EUGRSUZ_G01386 [Eucalyptus grandis]